MQIITCLANLREAATHEVFATLCAALECACSVQPGLGVAPGIVGQPGRSGALAA